MTVVAYLSTLIMGLVLGLLGGGGSILTVPILHYLFGIDAATATAYSLFVVGATAATGSASHMRRGNVDWASALWFGMPSIAGVFATRAWLLPALPATIGPWAKGTALLALFAILMLAAAISMIRPGKPRGPAPGQPRPAARLITVLEGIAVGALTGLVGAGGGFLIIPALVMLGGLGMKQAIGTSLVVIAVKSLVGFGGDLLAGLQADWVFLLACTGTAVVGILIGARLSVSVSAERLKPAFGWFVLAMGVVILATELGNR